MTKTLMKQITTRVAATRPTVTILALAGVLLSGCGGDNTDLTQFIDETKRRPAGAIEPLPSFRPYEAFTYAASTERSPFEPPVKALDLYYGSANSDIQPDLTRRKEYLEDFPLETLRMVGTLEANANLWALIDDRQGGIHRVRNGNYIGRDHGKVVATTPGQLTVVEIVSDGLDGWVERPRTLELSVQE